MRRAFSLHIPPFRRIHRWEGECNVNVYLFAAVILLLLIACAALAVPVALLSPKWLIAPAVLVVAALGVLWYQRRRLRTFVAKNLCSTDFENSASSTA